MQVIGVDVSKGKLHCAWLRDAARRQVRPKSVANSAEGHVALLAWATRVTGAAVAGLHVVLEATGVYHEAVLVSLQTMLDALTAEIARLRRRIDDHLDGHPEPKEQRALLQSIPGIGDKLSLWFLALFRGRGFASARQAAAFLGAAMRKLVHIAFGVLKHNKAFDPHIAA